MRKIVAGLFVSVDGVVEAPETWTGHHFSPEVGQLGADRSVATSASHARGGRRRGSPGKNNRAASSSGMPTAWSEGETEV